MDSRFVGDRMAVGVWRPETSFLKARGLDTGAPLQVAYVLDGSFALGVAAAICHLQLVDLVEPGFPQMLLVGVDYPEGALNARSRDYTMPDAVPDYLMQMLPAAPRARPGGAANFLRFLEEELDPVIRSRYAAKDLPAGLLGDSFGGTFACYVFLQQSRLFDRYWLGSPGIFTMPRDYVAEFETALDRPLAHDTRMFLSLGGREANGGVELYEDLGRNYHRIVAALDRRPRERLAWKSRVYEGLTHTSVFAPALNDALQFLFRPG